MEQIRPMVVTTLASCNVPENDHPEWSAATNYTQGAKVMVAGTHQCYESLIANNLNRNPIDATAWLPLGATNRWRMFDASIGSQTTQANSIQVGVQTSGRVNALALLNVQALSVTVTMTDAIEGEVYNKTFSMVAASGVNNWYAYFFEPIVRKRDLVIVDLPPYANSVITVTLNEPGGTAACGVLSMGLLKSLGGTRWGLSVGISDFSKRERDRWGGFIVTEGDYSKKGRFSLQVPAGQVDDLLDFLAQYRAKPAVYIGAQQFGSTVIYGYYKDFDVVISYATYSECSIEIEGLT
jgi:hypothetical protein